MEWLTQIGISAAGLPWWAVLLLLGMAAAARDVVPAVLKYRGFDIEREKYKDQMEKTEHDNLVEELRKRIEEIAKELAEVKREAREDRLTSSRLLAEEKDGHAKCKMDVVELRGEIRVMQKEIEALKRHDSNNTDHVKGLTQAVVKIDPNSAADLLP